MIHGLLMRATRARPAKAIDLATGYYIERYFVCKVGQITFYLHRYLNCDGDRWLHDHPWKWSIGIPLIGGYLEERLARLDPRTGVRTRMRSIWVGRPNLILGRTFHRIARVRRGTWTLFLHSQRSGSWGFLETLPPAVGESSASGRWVLYRQGVGVIDTDDNTPPWYLTAPLGAAFRAARGT